MARPKKAFDEVRGSVLGVRLTPAERIELDRAAAAYGISAAEYMRRRALGHRMPSEATEARSQAVLATALIRLGVNLNQLTRQVNAGKPLPGQAITDLTGRINAALDRLYDPRADRNRPQL